MRKVRQVCLFFAEEKSRDFEEKFFLTNFVYTGFLVSAIESLME